MSSPYLFFSEAQGLQLVNLLLAHLISDFVFQTRTMIDQKKWFSPMMGLHIAIVYGVTGILSGWWAWSAVIALMHWVTDALKVELDKKEKGSPLVLFVMDQILHVVVILLVWAQVYAVFPNLWTSVTMPFWDYATGLVVLGYMLVIWPVGYLIKFATQNIVKRVNPEEEVKENGTVEHGGRLIGQFERIIIFTFVLFSQYEAIGFLITGKSIIRFAQKEENLRSEYVLVGTMMSYAFCITAGVLINWLLALAS